MPSRQRTGAGQPAPSPFILDSWYVCAQPDEITRTPLARTICGERIMFYRREDGTPVAMEDRCCHRRMPLSKAYIVGDRVQCFYHGLEFEPDGTCVHVPGQSTVPRGAGVRTYPVTEQYNWVWIWMGDPALADGTPVVPYPWKDMAGWGDKGTYFHVRCNHQLIVDNLLDLTHLGYVHRSTIGNDAVAENADTRVFDDGDKVTVARWIVGHPPPPTYQKVGGWTEQDKVDRWQIIEFRPPGFVRLFTGAGKGAAGGAEFGFHELDTPTPEGGVGMRNLNAITPETETSCHYFWSQAQDIQPDSAEFTDMFYNQIRKAFEQDWEVFELQQENWDDGPVFATKSDLGLIAARKLVDRIKAGKAPAAPAQAAE